MMTTEEKTKLTQNSINKHNTIIFHKMTHTTENEMTNYERKSRKRPAFPSRKW